MRANGFLEPTELRAAAEPATGKPVSHVDSESAVPYIQTVKVKEPMPRPQEQVVYPATDRLRVLLAEDDPGVARSTVAVLHRLGHSVAHALDGVVAWRQLEHRLHDFDVLVLDLIMPRIGGSELARKARAAGFLGQIVLVSGLIMEIEPEALARLGIRKFLTKPFLPADLDRALRGLA